MRLWRRRAVDLKKLLKLLSNLFYRLLQSGVLYIYSFMMSFSNYNVRHSNLTSRESFSTYSKQQNSSMMYRGSQFSDVSFVIRSLYSTGTRTATPSSRTATRMARAKNITSETSISRYPKFGSRPCTSNLKPILQPCNHGVV